MDEEADIRVWGEMVKTNLEHSEDLIDELLAKLIATHLGKFLVVRSDTREHWIVDTEEETRRVTLRHSHTEPSPGIGVVIYSPILETARRNARLP